MTVTPIVIWVYFVALSFWKSLYTAVDSAPPRGKIKLFPNSLETSFMSASTVLRKCPFRNISNISSENYFILTRLHRQLISFSDYDNMVWINMDICKTLYQCYFVSWNCWKSSYILGLCINMVPSSSILKNSDILIEC